MTTGPAGSPAVPGPHQTVDRVHLAAFLAVAAFAVTTRLTLTSHLDFHAQPERELGHAVDFLRTLDPLGPGPEVGFLAAYSFDAGPWYSALLAPFLLLMRSPLAIVWLHGLVALLGLVAVFAFAARRAPPLVALLASLAWLASTDVLMTWEFHQWHCHAVSGLVLLVVWLADRFVERPSAWRLFGILALGAVAVQVFAAAGVLVAPLLGLAFWALARRHVRPLPGLAAGLGAALVSAPIVLRAWIAPALTLSLDVRTDASAAAPGWPLRLAAFEWERLQPGWTFLAPWFPTAVLVAVGVVAAVVLAVRRPGPFRGFLLGTLLITLAGTAWAYRSRGAIRYLIPLCPVLFIVALEGLGLARARMERALGAWPRAARGLAVALAAALWLPGVASGWTDRGVLPYPDQPDRLGASLVLGLGEQRAVVAWAAREMGWTWSDLCVRVHGKFCDTRHGIGAISILEDPRPSADRRAGHALLVVEGSRAAVAPERLLGETTLRGAYGRTLRLVRFRPPVAYRFATVERTAPDRRCSESLPYNPTFSVTVYDKLNPPGGGMDIPYQRPPVPCPAADGGTFRIFAPVIEPRGQALLMLDTAGETPLELLERATLLRHTRTAAGPGIRREVPIASAHPTDGSVAYVALSWGEETTAFELLLPADRAELVLVDVF